LFHSTALGFSFFVLDILSVSSRPLVSNGNSITQHPATNIMHTKRISAAVWWHPCTRLTATSGQIIPPILPIELATPMPVDLTDVGYIWQTKNHILSQTSNLSLMINKMVGYSMREDSTPIGHVYYWVRNVKLLADFCHKCDEVQVLVIVPDGTRVLWRRPLQIFSK